MGGHITALSPQRGRRGRLNLFIEGEFVLGLGDEEAVRAGLRVGLLLDDAAIETLREADEESHFYNDALHFLSFRPRSSSEIERYLARRGAPPDRITTMIERLRDVGLVDDAAFSRYWIENRAEFSPRGARALGMELRAKGVERDDIDEALEGAPDEEDLARQAALKRSRSWARLDEEEFMRRMYAFLQRRGFGHETARATTRRLWDERSEDK